MNRNHGIDDQPTRGHTKSTRQVAGLAFAFTCLISLAGCTSDENTLAETAIGHSESVIPTLDSPAPAATTPTANDAN